MSEFLVFKGGACVQSYIDPMFQRASNDLDFNKLALIAGRTKRDAGELIGSSAGTVMAFGERFDVARGGKELIREWEIGCEKTAGKILRLI